MVLLSALAALALAFGTGGCTYRLDPLSSKAETKVAAAASPAALKAAETSAEADLTFAKATAVEVLGRGSQDASLPWENPRTGARGTVTPIASAYTQDGLTCHDFLASYVNGTKESWFQGDACRIHGGRWEVRDLRPLQRT